MAVAAAGAGAAGIFAVNRHGSPNTPPGVASYLCYSGPTSGNATLLQWKTDTNGRISGTYQNASFTGTAPSEQVNTTSGALSGQVSGSGVSVHMGFGNEVFGKVTSSKLTLNVPQQDGAIQPVTCPQGGAAAWNQALAGLNRRVGQLNAIAQAQQQQAQQQQQDSKDYQTAQNDLSTLQQDQGNIGSELSALAADVKGTNSDLAGERKDAARGVGSGCYNLSANVDYDAESNVEYDVQSNVGYDLGSLTSDISTVRQDISTLQGDLQTLASDGVQDPSGASAVIASAQGVIRQAIKQANSDIGQANADLATAYALANGMATGQCSGYGPGSPSAPLKHI